MTKFQIILTAVFGIFLVGGVIIFSAYRGSSDSAVEVVIWGTMPSTSFSNIVQGTSLYQSKQYKINYIEKSADTFDAEFIEALASGQGPDLFMLPSEKILKHRNKIFPIPYDVYTERQFKDSFIEGAEVYMAPEGILGLPVSADPLVMYWNRAIFRDARLTEPPKYWDEFYELAALISKKDGALNISKSAVAFGEFANIAHAKEIILNLAMQAGTPVVVWGDKNPLNVFEYTYDKPVLPAEAAVNFYTEFGNPGKQSYSWNRSLTNSTNYFLGGDLALYFGKASEIRVLQLKNPNLNFDVALVPVSREGGVDVSFTDFNAFAITKASNKINAAFGVMSILAQSDAGKLWLQETGLPPVRRELLRVKPKNAYQSVFYESVIRSKTWLDPEPVESNKVFRTMIESITSGRSRTLEAVSAASRELSNLLVK